MKKLGAKLAEYREKAFPGESLRRVADKLGMDYSYLSRLEKGFYRPSDEKIALLSGIYELSDIERMELFLLAHDTPEYNLAIQDVGEKNFVAALYRKNKNKK